MGKLGDDDLLERLRHMDPDQAAAALVRVLNDHPERRSDLLRAIRENAPDLYAAWLLRAAIG